MRIALVGIAGVLLLLSACGDGEEELAPTSPTLTVAPTATPTASLAPTPISPSSIPADWPSYADPEGRFTLRYPLDWHRGEAFDFYSNDPSTFPVGRPLPPEVIKVEVIYSTAIGSDVCGPVLKTNPETGQVLGLLPGATPASLGGIDGGRLVRALGDPALEDGITRIEGLGVVVGDSCVLIVAYYTQQSPNIEIFSRIAGSFAFRNAPPPQ